MISITTIDKVPMGELHKCFAGVMGSSSAASKITPETMMHMNTIRGVDYRVSLCAMNEQRMVAFILNSIGVFDGKRTAYDIGAGVIPEFRATTLSKDLFVKAKELLTQYNLQQYMLDVDIENEQAKKLYESLDFKEVRKFSTMLLKGRPLSVVKQRISIENAPKEKWTKLIELASEEQSILPSWYNTWEIIYRMPSAYTVKVATLVGDIAGFIIYTEHSGIIHQMWVSSRWRSSGVASALMANVAINSKAHGRLIWHNIDTRAADLLRFLRHRGFVVKAHKLEMSADLTNKAPKPPVMPAK